MYRINKKISFKNQKQTAELIGIAPETLSKILNGKVKTTKVLAYCITKCYDKDAEILDYFVYE